MAPQDKRFNPLDDGGLASRKFIYSVGVSLSIVGLGCLAAFWPPFRASLETTIGGLIASAGLYMGANLTHAWTMSKTVIATKKPPLEEPAEESEPK